MFTRILSIHARLYLDPKDHEMSQLKSPNGNNKLVSKRYIFDESNPKSNSNGLQAPAQAPPAPRPLWIPGLLGGIIVIVIVVVVRRVVEARWKKNPSYPSMFDPIRETDEAIFPKTRFTAPDFDDMEIIGRGGSGEVYKAIMASGSTLAIKKIVRPMESGREGDTTTNSLNDTRSLNNTTSLNTKLGQVRSEILTVGKMQHRNIHRLYGYFWKPDGDYIISEYMKNGSLQDLLQEVKEGGREFNWLARHSVALGVANGLEYMHMNMTLRLVHRDLKPANILLGVDMEAKIADFGIAKFIPDTETHITSSKFAGSMGYIAPEYYETMKFDEKCDIYSFGVVLAVLVMGKLPSDEFFRKSELSLLKWMRIVMTGEDPKQAIDLKLMGNGYEEQMLLALKIACYCTHDNPEKRPTSKEARIMLSQIIH